MCDNCNKECEICGCPIVNDDSKGEGCINGGCPTNKEDNSKDN